MKKIDASLQLTRQIVSYIWEKIEKKELIPSSSPIDIDTLINSGKLFCHITYTTVASACVFPFVGRI